MRLFLFICLFALPGCFHFTQSHLQSGWGSAEETLHSPRPYDHTLRRLVTMMALCDRLDVIGDKLLVESEVDEKAQTAVIKQYFSGTWVNNHIARIEIRTDPEGGSRLTLWRKQALLGESLKDSTDRWLKGDDNC